MSASILHDSSSVLHNGSNILFAGRLFSGLKSNNVSPEITIPHNADTDLTEGSGVDTPHSISCIYRIPNSSSQRNMFLYAKANTALNLEVSYQAINDRLFFRLTDGTLGGNYIQCFADISEDQSSKYNHVIYTYDGSNSENGMSIYLNSEELSVTRSQNGIYPGQGDNYTNIYIIRPNYTTGGEGATAMFSYKLFNKVLSESERNQLFDSENFARVAESNLIINYDFRDKSGTILSDQSGNGYDGSISLNDGFWCNPYTEIAI